MSRIKAVDFGKYVDSSRVLLAETLKSKGVDVDEKKSLNTHIQQINKLPDLEAKNEYEADPLFERLEQEYIIDPLRTKNGGEYEYCYFTALKTTYATSVLKFPVKDSYRIITSDGQDILLENVANNSTYTITWDSSKDVDKLLDGTLVRWIKIYSNVVANNGSCYYACYETSTAAKYASPVLFCLIDNASLPGIPSTGAQLHSLAYTDVRYVILGEHITILRGSSSSSPFNCCRNLECVKSYNYLKIECAFPGSESPKIKYLPKISSISSDGNITSYANDVLDLSNVIVTKTGSLFANSSITQPLAATSLLVPDEWTQYSGIYYGFYGKTLFVPKSLAGNELYIYVYNVTELYIPSDFYNSLNFGTDYGKKLSKESFNRIAANIRDFTDGESHYLKMPSHLQALLTQEEIEVATNKNWTVTFA